MNKKKFLTIIFILMIIVMCIPKPAMAWIEVTDEQPSYNNYDNNYGNIKLALFLRAVFGTIPLIYIIMAFIYVKFSEDNKNKKIKNLIIWLIITVIVVSYGLFTSSKMLGQFSRR